MVCQRLQLFLSGMGAEDPSTRRMGAEDRHVGQDPLSHSAEHSPALPRYRYQAADATARIKARLCNSRGVYFCDAVRFLEADAHSVNPYSDFLLKP